MLLSLQSAAVAQGAQPEPESSGGQSALVPVQYSGTSHGPADGRHTVLAGRKPSLGHVLLVPSQVSATSHTPAAGRHTVPAFPGTLSQNFTPPVPLTHLSTVHGLRSSQSVSELQFGGASTQSDGSEFGCWDG